MADPVTSGPGPAPTPTPLDAIVVASSAPAKARVLGLTLAERGRRVAAKAGARRVFVLDTPARAGELMVWRAAATPGAALLVIHADDQVVHPPLVEPLLAGSGDRRVAITPEGAYAGALWARGGAVDEVVSALVGNGDRALVARWTDAERHVHGDIARHPATTPDERRAAERMLLRLLLKTEDGPITRYVYRPVSRPLTRVLVHTPITPNQVSIAVFVIGMIGCWLTTYFGQAPLIAGAALVLFAGFLDGCDGEIARLRLLSSKLGAWLDTIVDEATTTVYFLAIGYHVYLHRPDAWVVPSIAVGTVCYLSSIYAIYYFLIVVSRTGNSQHYQGRLDIVDDPQRGLGLRARTTAPSSAPPWLRTLGFAAMQTVRRDFINLAALAMCLFDQYLMVYACMLIGGIGAAVTVVPEHVRLRGQLRELARRGGAPRLLPAP